MTFKKEFILDYSGSLSVFNWAFKQRSRSQKTQNLREALWGKLDLSFLALNMERVVMNQRMQAASRRGKGQENRFSPKASRKGQPY